MYFHANLFTSKKVSVRDTMNLQQYIPTIISTILGFATTSLLTILVNIVNRDKQEKTQKQHDIDLLKDAMKHILLSEIKADNAEYVSKGWCSSEDKEEFTRKYQTYHGLKGNGLGTRLWLEVLDLPSTPIHMEIKK